MVEFSAFLEIFFPILTFTLKSVVPWGRSFKEYARMFALTTSDLESRILGCADGPASFNAEATRRGTRVISCDPLYRYSRRKIRMQINVTYPQMLEQTRQNHQDFVWTEFANVDEVGRVRMEAMEIFLGDYEVGLQEGRYIDAELPSLPFQSKSFDLALCANFLFLYSEQLNEVFHVQGIVELLRVAKEVRIFPIMALGGVRSNHLIPVSKHLRNLGLNVTIEEVPYEFVRGCNAMMRVSGCTV